MDNQDEFKNCIYENVVTASIDILGFKSIICQTNGHEKARNIISNLYKNLYLKAYPTPDCNSNPIELFFVSEEFSDSVFVYSDPKLSIPEQLGRILPLIISSLFIGVFISQEKYLLRAGISIGNLMISEINIDNNITKTIRIGTSIINAHELETDQDWFGGAISEELIKHLTIHNKHYIKEYTIPSKSKNKIKYALNWVDMRNDHTNESFKNYSSNDVSTLIENVFKETGLMDKRVLQKLNNTIDFIKHVMDSPHST